MHRRDFLRVSAAGVTTAAASPTLAATPGPTVRVDPVGRIRANAQLLAHVAGVPVCVWDACGISVGGATEIRGASHLVWRRAGHPDREIRLGLWRQAIRLPLPGEDAALILHAIT